MSDNLTEARVTKIPDCDFCKPKKVPAAYDGATRLGPWGFMCEEHFQKYGRGLGTGVGQKLIKKEEGK